MNTVTLNNFSERKKNKTCCRRSAATVCPRLSPAPVGAEALCAAEQTAM